MTATTAPAAPAAELATVTAEAVQEAAKTLGGIFGDGMTAGMVGGHFTCREADNIASALVTLGQAKAAADFLVGHSDADDDPDDDEDHLNIAEPKAWQEKHARAAAYISAFLV